MKLATIEQIKDVRKHPNADRLELVDVLGYQLVCEKGIHKPGDVVVYIQPDTVLPDEPWAETYRKYSPKRVKAVKLRGEWSEGIIVRWEQLKGILAEGLFFMPKNQPDCVLGPDDERVVNDQYVGMDVACVINVFKYEPPAPQDLSAKRALPFDIPKTDEERWENIEDNTLFGSICDVTLKIDGQSWSAFYNHETKECGVCGRTLEFKDGVKNRFTAHLDRYPNMKSRLIEYCTMFKRSICIRGESYGPSIQNLKLNPHSKGESGLAIFSVYLIDERRYARKFDPMYFVTFCDVLDLPMVPILEENAILTPELIRKYSIEMKTLPSGDHFEGVVINHRKGSFKVINKYYDANK